jgi:hypothetical protein
VRDEQAPLRNPVNLVGIRANSTAEDMYFAASRGTDE